MTVTFRKKTDKEKVIFITDSIESYAQEFSKIYDISLEEALEVANKQIYSALENKKQINKIESIIDNPSNKVIGDIWYSLNQSSRKIFIYQFLIYEKERGRGYGKLALETLHHIYKKKDFKQVSLSVFANNLMAQKVYQKLGYQTIRLTMKKDL